MSNHAIPTSRYLSAYQTQVLTCQVYYRQNDDDAFSKLFVPPSIPLSMQPRSRNPKSWNFIAYMNVYLPPSHTFYTPLFAIPELPPNINNIPRKTTSLTWTLNQTKQPDKVPMSAKKITSTKVENFFLLLPIHLFYILHFLFLHVLPLHWASLSSLISPKVSPSFF